MPQLTETTGSQSVTGAGTETTLFDVSALGNYAATIFIDPMAAGDTIIIKVYVKDTTAVTLKQIYTNSYTGVQSGNTAIHIPWIATPEFKVTMQSTAGVTHTYNWSRYNV